MNRTTNKDFKRNNQERKKYEEDVLILDIIEKENIKVANKQQTIIQCIGKKYFSLLELVITNDTTLEPLLNEINLEKIVKDKNATIYRRISYEKLTKVAKTQINEAVERIIAKSNQKCLDFLNNAPSLSIRLHSLQLIKGVGPKARDLVIQARKEKKFISFEDFTERTRIKDIQILLQNRIVFEITEKQPKHRLFTRFPPDQY